MRLFAEVCGKSSILTDKEKSDIYYLGILLDSKNDSANTEEEKSLFSTVPRIKALPYSSVIRFGQHGGGWNCTATIDAIQFATPKPISLHGVGIYGTKSGFPIGNVRVDINGYGKSMTSVETRDVACNGTTAPVPILLTNEVRLEPDMRRWLLLNRGTMLLTEERQVSRQSYRMESGLHSTF